MEIWKSYNNDYQVSNLGNVKSLKYNKEKILKQSKNSEGYKFVKLYIDGEKKTMAVHRLVATLFLENPNNFQCINHKDEIKSNNKSENLEWCSSSYNRLYGSIRNKIIKTKNSTKKVIIAKYNLQGEYLCKYNSISDASRHNKISNTSIYRCINNITHQAGGFIWVKV